MNNGSVCLRQENEFDRLVKQYAPSAWAPSISSSAVSGVSFLYTFLYTDLINDFIWCDYGRCVIIWPGEESGIPVRFLVIEPTKLSITRPLLSQITHIDHKTEYFPASVFILFWSIVIYISIHRLVLVGSHWANALNTCTGCWSVAGYRSTHTSMGRFWHVKLT